MLLQNDDDWYDQQQARRELDPDEFGETPNQSIAGGIGQEAVGRATDKAKDKIADKAKNKVAGTAGKKAGQELGKKAAEEGAKKAASAAVAAGGGAATGGVSTAIQAGATVADKGFEKGLQAIGINKKDKNKIYVAIVSFPIIVAFLLLPLIAVLIPVMIANGIKEVAYEVVKAIPLVRGAIIAKTGLELGVDALNKTVDGIDSVKDAAAVTVVGAAKKGTKAVTDLADGARSIGDKIIPDGVPLIGYEFNDMNLQQVATTLPDGTVQLAAANNTTVKQTISSDSRLAVLFKEMWNSGYFQAMAEKYEIRIDYHPKTKKMSVYLEDKLIKKVNNSNELGQLFENNQKLADIMVRSLEHDVKVWNYSQRVTLAEKGLSDYRTNQLYIPDADKAKTSSDVATVKQGSKSTQNDPSVEELSGSLKCTKIDCGTWTPETIKADNEASTKTVVARNGFTSTSTMDTIMRDRFKNASREDDSNESLYQMLTYVVELKRSSEITDPEEIANDTFIQGVLETRKTQAARSWAHMQTQVDQFMANEMTSETASALFRDLNGIGSAKAFKKINGQTGGNGFEKYQKINDNQKNITTAIYQSWAEKNPKYAKLIDELESRAPTGDGGVLGFFINKIKEYLVQGLLDSDTDYATAVTKAYEFASQATTPACDSNIGGERYMNCMFAGAEVMARDIGISDYGANGAIGEAELAQTQNYIRSMNDRIFASRPLYERLFAVEEPKSLLSRVALQSELPFDASNNPTVLAAYLAKLPSITLANFSASLSKQVSAAESSRTINNIDPAGIKLSSLRQTAMSTTLNEAGGGLESCPETGEDQENMCRADETTYKALAASFGIDEAADGMDFVVGSYNILNTRAHAGKSRSVGGCLTNPLPGDPDCLKTRGDYQTKIITGENGNPAFDIVGLQEVSPEQYDYLKSQLSGYEAFPESTERMSNSQDGSLATFWRADVFSLVESGKSDAISNTSKNITAPWVGLRSYTGQMVYVMNIHYATAGFGGTPESIRNSSEKTMAWVNEKLSDNSIVIVTGDFNDKLNEKNSYCVYTKDAKMQHALDMKNKTNKNKQCPGNNFNGIDHIYASPRDDLSAKSFIKMPRNTEAVKRGSDHSPVYAKFTIGNNTEMKMRIASYNIYGAGHTNGGDAARSKKQTDLIKEMELDVVGFQEMTPEQFGHYKNNLDSFDFHPSEFVGPPNFTSPDAIGWNKSKYTVVEKGTDPHKYFDGKNRKHPWVLLQDNATKQKFYVMNTHDPAHPENSKYRYENAKSYVPILEQRAQEGYPMFFTGDFNSGYTVRTSGNTTYQGQRDNLTYCILTAANTTMWDAYDSKFDLQGQCPTDTGGQQGQANCGPKDEKCNNRAGNSVDHIFMSRSVTTERYWKIPPSQNGSDVHDTIVADISYPVIIQEDQRAPTAKTTPYKNAVWGGSSPDPSVIRGDDGTYHVYATGGTGSDPFVHLTSEDLVNWKRGGRVFKAGDVPPLISGENIRWAPDVAKVGNRYVLTFTGGSFGNRQIGYATSDSAGGPFNFRGVLMRPNTNGSDGPGTIDPNIVTQGNKTYLVWGGGNIRIIELNVRGNGSMSTKGAAKLLLSKPSNGNQIEGAYVINRDGWFYLFYSYGKWESKGGSNEYSTRVARSRNITGPYTPAANNARSVLTGTGSDFRGPGHNSVATDDAGQDWIVYHAWHKGKRSLMIDPIVYEGGWPKVNDGHPSRNRVADGPIIGKDADGNTSTGDLEGDWAWPLGRQIWDKYPQSFLGSHYAGGGFLGNGGSSVDIGFPGDTGSPIFSMLDGKVIKQPLGRSSYRCTGTPNVSNNGGMSIESKVDGKTVVIAYAHGSNPQFRAGQEVKAGQQILRLGNVGNSCGSHLHMDMTYGGKNVCLQDVFRAMDKGSVNLSLLAAKATSTCG